MVSSTFSRTHLSAAGRSILPSERIGSPRFTSAVTRLRLTPRVRAKVAFVAVSAEIHSSGPLLTFKKIAHRVRLWGRAPPAPTLTFRKDPQKLWPAFQGATKTGGAAMGAH